MISEIKVSLMTRDDLKGVCAIENRSYSHPWASSIFESELANPDQRIYLVAWLSEKIVGYGGMMINESDGHITNLAVDLEYRKQGIGCLLTLRLIEMAILKGLHWLTLEVRESNLEARRLYEGFGFRGVGVRRKYYSDGEGALIMWTDDIASDEYRGRIQRIKKELSDV